MKVEIMKKRNKGFMCLIQVMIYDKKVGGRQQFYTVPKVTCKKAALLNGAFPAQIYMKEK